METDIAGNGATVVIRYRLTLPEGVEGDATGENEDLTFVFGDGTLVSALEERLRGLSVGESARFEIPATEMVFGFPDDEKIQTLPRSDFEEQVDLVRNSLVSFDLPNGDEVLGIIQDVNDNEVVVDFNHPLIGRDFIFEVELVSVS